MTETFLHAPFDDADVLARILGEAPPSRPAALADHVLRSDPDAVRVAPVVSDGGRVAGRVVDLTEAQVERLDFAMAALGAVPAAVDGRGGRAAGRGAGLPVRGGGRRPRRGPRSGPAEAPGAARRDARRR